MSDQPNPIQLADVLITEELARRSSRQPNLSAENEALRSLAWQLAHAPDQMLQRLVELARELCDADTAGVSLIETQPNGEEDFRWGALAGALANQVGGWVSRHFSPCGVCLEQGTPVLFAYPERYFTALQQANLPMPKMLVLPLVVAHQPLGTLWLVAHHAQRQFDPEDVRLMTGLADFTAATLQRHQQRTRALQVAHTALQQESTERQRAQEQALALVENLPGGAAFVVDRDLRYTMAAGEALEAANFQPEDFVGRTIFEVLPPELATSYEPLYRQALAGAPFEHEHQAHNRCYITRGTPLRAGDGEIYGVLAVSYDITDRQRVEDERQQADQARLQSIANLVPDLLWESEPDGSTNWYNQRWMEYTGQTFEQAISWGWVDAIHPDDRAGSARRYREAVERGMPLQQEHRIRRYDGEYRWFVVKTSPLKDESGKVIKMYGTAIDIHEQRVAREQQKEALFDSLDEGLALVEMIYDEQGEIVDMIFRQVNRAYERQGGVYNVVGRSIFDVIPGVEDYWLDLYKRVAKTGEPMRTENYQQDVDRWFDVYFSRVDDNGRFVAIVFSDISDRKRAEATLRENKARQSFLLKLSEILQQFVEPNDIKTAAMHLLGEHLGVSRAQYYECDSSGEYYTADGIGYANGLPLLDLKYRIDQFGTFVNEDFAAGRPYRIDDLEVSPRVSAEEREAYRSYGIRAGAGVPLIRGGKLVAILAVHDVHPHPWTDLEIELIRETAERIWTPLERARAEVALRASEEKYRSLFTSIDEGFTLLEMIPDESGHAADFRIVETNPAWEQQTGLTDATGKTLLEISPNFEQQWLDFYSDVVISGRGRRTEYYTADVNRWYTVYASRIGGAGSRQVAVVFNDITELKRAEAQLRRTSEMDAFRVKLSDALRSLADPVEIQSEAARVIGEHLGAGRAAYAEIAADEAHFTIHRDYTNGVPSFVGHYPNDSYAPAYFAELRAGRTVTVTDAEHDARLSEADRVAYAAGMVRAAVAVPLNKGGRLAAVFFLHFPVPHEWSADEVALVEETAERTWAAVERAHAEAALRESELQRVREQSAREQEQQRAETLAELNRAKTLFFSNVSHEFRTPLTLLLGPLEEAIKSVDEWMSGSVDENPSTHPPIHPSTLHHNLHLAHRNALRLLKLVNTLLDFSRVEADRLHVNYQPTDLAAYTADLASLFRSTIESAGLQFTVDCPPLPQPATIDREMLSFIRIFCNNSKVTKSY